MILRPYQELAVQELRDGIRNNPGKPGLLVAPTGSGKSEIFGWMARSAVSKNHKVGAMVNRRILVNDLCKRVDRLGLEHGIIMSGSPRKAWAPVQIASFDTLWRRPHLPKLDLCFIDECHFSLADRYSQVIARFAEQGAVIIGMTATPCRGTEGLGAIYKWMVRCPDTPDLIDAGYLVRPRVFAPPGQPDVRKVDKVAGEFNQKQLAQVCDNAKITGDILAHWLKNGRGMPTIGFGVDIAHCQHMAEMFCAAGVRAIAVDHKYRGDFDEVWRKLATYETEVVFNVGIAGYGWNCPAVQVLIEARPTQSPGLWIQHCGRVLRAVPKKEFAIILDHAGNSLRHGLPDDPRDWSLEGDAIKKEKQERVASVATCRKCYFTFRAGPLVCPSCHAELPRSQRQVEVEAGELMEIQRPKNQEERLLAAKIAKEQKSEYYKLLAVASKRGFRPGWAVARFSERYGFGPPREWRGASQQSERGWP